MAQHWSDALSKYVSAINAVSPDAIIFHISLFGHMISGVKAACWIKNWLDKRRMKKEYYERLLGFGKNAIWDGGFIHPDYPEQIHPIHKMAIRKFGWDLYAQAVEDKRRIRCRLNPGEVYPRLFEDHIVAFGGPYSTLTSRMASGWSADLLKEVRKIRLPLEFDERDDGTRVVRYDEGKRRTCKHRKIKEAGEELWTPPRFDPRNARTTDRFLTTNRAAELLGRESL